MIVRLLRVNHFAPIQLWNSILNLLLVLFHWELSVVGIEGRREGCGVNQIAEVLLNEHVGSLVLVDLLTESMVSILN